MDICQALTNGSISHDAEGHTIKHPPTSLMLHAARAIKQLEGINANNNSMIHFLQLRVSELADINIQLTNELTQLKKAAEVATEVATEAVPEVATEAVPEVATEVPEHGIP